MFTLLLVWLLVGAVFSYGHAGWLLAGGIVGSALGQLGVRLTQFESDDEGHTYKPNLWLGLAVSGLFVGRLAYRATELWMAGHASATIIDQTTALSAATLAVLGLVCGFYATQAIALLRWHRFNVLRHADD